MINHQKGQNDQRYGDDQLQTAYHEDERTVGHGAEDPQAGLNQSSHRHHKHDGHRTIKHPALAAGCLQEDREASEHQSREKLICGTKERPNRHVAREAERIAHGERQDRRENGIRKELLDRSHRFTGARGEQFLQRHTADARHSINRCQSQSRNAHRKDAGSNVGRHTEDIGEESGDGPGERLERRARRKYAVARRGADDDQRHDAENDFNAHGAVAHKTHVLFVGNHL